MAELYNIDMILCLVNVKKSKFYLGGSDVSVARAHWFPGEYSCRCHGLWTRLTVLFASVVSLTPRTRVFTHYMVDMVPWSCLG